MARNFYNLMASAKKKMDQGEAWHEVNTHWPDVFQSIDNKIIDVVRCCPELFYLHQGDCSVLGFSRDYSLGHGRDHLKVRISEAHNPFTCIPVGFYTLEAYSRRGNNDFTEIRAEIWPVVDMTVEGHKQELENGLFARSHIFAAKACYLFVSQCSSDRHGRIERSILQLADLYQTVFSTASRLSPVLINHVRPAWVGRIRTMILSCMDSCIGHLIPREIWMMIAGMIEWELEWFSDDDSKMARS